MSRKVLWRCWLPLPDEEYDQDGTDNETEPDDTDYMRFVVQPCWKTNLCPITIFIHDFVHASGVKNEMCMNESIQHEIDS
jgi:hypothetical protein